MRRAVGAAYQEEQARHLEEWKQSQVQGKILYLPIQYDLDTDPQLEKMIRIMEGIGLTVGALFFGFGIIAIIVNMGRTLGWWNI